MIFYPKRQRKIIWFGFGKLERMGKQGWNKVEIDLEEMHQLAAAGESWPKIAEHFGE